MSSDMVSHLQQISSRKTELRAVFARDGEALEAGTCFVAGLQSRCLGTGEFVPDGSRDCRNARAALIMDVFRPAQKRRRRCCAVV